MEVKKWIRNSISEEKLRIIECDESALVTANPGTGKTFLLAYKYLNLIENGISPDDILCLTFTTKAKKELENRIIKFAKENNVELDASKINVYTFHSFTLENDKRDIVSSNLLRYSIYDYLKKNNILNYGDDYLLSTIVPKMERLILYLKNYQIRPTDLSIDKIKENLEGDDKNSKEEMNFFAENFIKIFEYYENIKSKKGIDYVDMLLNFLEKENTPIFGYVLVDEMQDVNRIEAQIALKCAKKFTCVGDKKQAIMGFQGGSISNLKLFDNSKHFILSNNFRSSQEILEYAKNKFVSSDESNSEELENLKNIDGIHSEKPKIYVTDKKDIYAVACELAKNLLIDNKKVAIITRTNSQISKVAMELSARDIEFSSTYFASSTSAKEEIITFLKGLLSEDIKAIKHSIFTIFSPLKLDDAFELVLKSDSIIKRNPIICEMKSKIRNLTDVNLFFEKYIIPISVAYGENYLLAAISMRKALQESLSYLEDIGYKQIIDFLSSSELETKDINEEKQLVLTTVHKAKGQEFDAVIYIPAITKDDTNFQDKIVEAILKTKGIDASQEVDEENLRIDFVAYTRAKKHLSIISEKNNYYIEKYSDMAEYTLTESYVLDIEERSKKAFTLFVNHEYDEAKKYLEMPNSWLISYIKAYFNSMEHISFTSLNTNPLDFLKQNILKIPFVSSALDLGSDVHEYAENLLNGKEYKAKEESKSYCENLKSMVDEIKKEYPKVEFVEEKFKFNIKDLFNIDYDFNFTGMLDAVFSNGDRYLIVDWKTSKKEDGSSYRQQLTAYKKALMQIKNISEDKINIAIGYVGLRPTINLGQINSNFDSTQPRANVINTLKDKINIIVEWKKNPNSFIDSLYEFNDYQDRFFMAIKEQIKKERE